jgi:hypothetical protein
MTWGFHDPYNWFHDPYNWFHDPYNWFHDPYNWFHGVSCTGFFSLFFSALTFFVDSYNLYNLYNPKRVENQPPVLI